MTPQNIAVLSKNFAALPIDTIERLENTVDLVFEKVINNYISVRVSSKSICIFTSILQAIQNQSFAQLCADLCSATLPVKITCKDSKVTTSFQVQILRKCQSSFEADKAQRMDSVKKLAEIKSCRNFVIDYKYNNVYLLGD